MNVLFHASSVGHLMTNGRGAKCKEAKSEEFSFGQTAYNYIVDRWLNVRFGYKQTVMSKEMLKGLLCEQDSLAIAQNVLGGGFRANNKQRNENFYFTGEHDTTCAENGKTIVEDIKSSWDLRTFFNAELTPLYFCQLQVYMDLLNLEKARLIYCLVDTPITLIVDEFRKTLYGYGLRATNQELEDLADAICSAVDNKELRNDASKLAIEVCGIERAARDLVNIARSHTFSHIDEDQRVKVFPVERDNDYLEELKLRVKRARSLMATLKLN